MGLKKRAWLYCRIDAPEDAHGMLKGQKKELYDYADQLGFTIVGCSEDLGSGLKYNRPGLIAVERAAEQDRMDVLLVKQLSRLGRDSAQTLDFLRKLEQSGIKLYSPLEGEIRLFRDINAIHELTMGME
ncbi:MULTISPECIES: recombinase family protein [unclassified Caproiciproducens]|uniref:recombinase family protein n=1 Tax=Caproiciproducens sp. R1 TaxID=3435000 RepID=UPI0040331783